MLLLGCALSRYLWDVNTTVGSVTIGITSFGVLFLFIAVAASGSCPYQTLAARILSMLYSVVFPLIQESMYYFVFTGVLSRYKKHEFPGASSLHSSRSFPYPFSRTVNLCVMDHRLVMLEIRDRVGNAANARNAGSTLQGDNITVPKDLTFCALSGQEFLRSEDGEGIRAKQDERVDESHREGWDAFSFSERTMKEGWEGAGLEESSEPKVPMATLCRLGAFRQGL